MQRVRIGLTGLAFVFVLVLIGAVFTSPSAEEPITANSVAGPLGRGAGAPPPDNASAPKEPLAVVGVAPGNVDDNSATAGTTAAAATPQQP
jgi:hypothetical protein